MVNAYIWREKRDITAADQLQYTGYDRATMKRCWEFLDATSRSFSMVIKELEGDLARVVRLCPIVSAAAHPRRFGSRVVEIAPEIVCRSSRVTAS